MAQGRGSLLVPVVVLCSMLLSSQMTDADFFTVGDSRGWTFNTVNWPTGKQFRAGDTLFFKYSPGVHNVVAVDGVGFNACATPKGARTYTSGRDQIKLAKGNNFFICSFPGHCQSGMKIAVHAA